LAAAKHARAIIAAARRELKETNASDPLGSLWGDDELLEWANEAQAQIGGEIIDLDEDFFGDFFEITTEAQNAIYDLPSRFISMQQVEYIAGGDRADVPEGRARSGSPPVLASTNPSEGPFFNYALYNDQIHFDPPPAGVLSPGFRCWCVLQPADLTYGKASAGASSSITLQAADDASGFGASGEDDYYNKSWIVLTGGLGAGQRRRIVDYGGSSKQATVSPAWSTNPDTTTLYATETLIPEPVWRMVQLFAAIAAKGKYGMDARHLVARYNSLEEKIPSLERRTKTERGIQPFDPDDGL